VPVLLGGLPTPGNFAAIAEYGDGWMPVGGSGLGDAIPELRRTVEDSGRDPDQIRVVPFGTIPTGEKLEYFASLGVGEVVLRVPGGDRSAVLAVLDAYAVFTDRFGGDDG
jgi:alkanesulfonate monooxygenase SsuD/methylene tetrahydromethanopterin reductase-like flavin-dependent oxidoreductase (luciferase family)